MLTCRQFKTNAITKHCLPEQVGTLIPDLNKYHNAASLDLISFRVYGNMRMQWMLHSCRATKGCTV